MCYNEKRVEKGKKALLVSYTYAVVDIETTSTNIERGKIIQFACVFIKAGKIIDSFSTYINPGELIDESIQQLTGITNQMVKDAPYFDEVASIIQTMLEDCVFVAHNVAFDYPFLQRRLKECGFTPVHLKAIDTVELAQIAFPTLTSYRLSDLAHELGLMHTHPHRADSDAEVTAELLLKIRQKLLSLPMVTLKQLRKLSKDLALNTGWFFHHLLKIKQKQEKQWNHDIQVVSGIALQKRKAVPEILYQPQITIKLRSTQQKMVADMQSFLQEEGHELVIEAPTGTGKTLSYLYALKDQISMAQPLIISTSTLVLQQQIIEQAVPMVNQFSDRPLRATLLKSPHHYIDLARFVATLDDEGTKQIRLYQMQILVWLTQTKTGDMDELHLPTKQHPYWQQIQHRGLEYLDNQNPYYGVDFMRRLAKEVHHSDVIIVNHSLLVEQANRSLLPKTKYLVIDEAQKFSRVYQQSATMRLSPLKFTRLRKQIEQLLKPELVKKNELASLKRGLDFYYQALKQFTSDMTLRYQSVEVNQEWQVIPQFADLTTAEKQTVAELLNVGHDLLKLIQSVDDEKSLGDELRQSLHDLADFITGFNQFLTVKDDSLCREVQGRHQQIWFQVLKGMNQRLQDEKWFQSYRKVFFIGGTLLIAGSIQYFARELGFKELPFCEIPEVFDYQKQGHLYVLTDQNEGENWYDEQRTAQLLVGLALTTQRKVMCLLTSHTSLELVYHELEEQLSSSDVEVLAQNITGSKEKNLWRFENASQGILLGTDAFWEGIDLPGKALEILVIGKLPFLSPQMNFQSYKEKWLRSQGLNPFYDDALPRAILRLRQGFGRLLRTNEDKGVMILLDRRFVDSRYANVIQQALPKKLKMTETTEKKVVDQVASFFNEENCRKDSETV